MTQKEIAGILNISRSTVSLALSDSPRINHETRRKVQELARKINYHPNMAARGLVMGKTRLIGILLNSFAHRFLGELSNSIFKCLNARGYSAIFGAGTGNEIHSLVDTMTAHQVDGIIAYSEASEELVRLNENGIPVVVYRYPGSFPLSYVNVDRYEGGRMLVNHLVETGRRRIAYIGGIDCFDRRFEGYQAALLENNLEVEKSRVVPFSGEMKEGVEGMQLLLKQTGKTLPDAVIFHNDAMAIGGMGEALRRGIEVPQKMAIAGFDDIEEAEYCVPSLTTIRQPREQIAAELVDMLLHQIEKNDRILRKRILAPTLVVRDSTRAGLEKNRSSMKQ